MNGRIALSVVVPVFNEMESLPELHDRLVKTLDNAGLHAYELIFVDDGSTDGGYAQLRELAATNARVRAVKLARNFGQHVALSAGMERSRGEIIVFMDADLQNAPEDIPQLIAKVREGYDLVSGWRVSRRKPGLTRRFGSSIVNRVITSSTGVSLHDHNCGFKAVTRRIAEEASRYGHLRRFLVPLLLTLARSVGEVPIADNARQKGQSKYNFFQLFSITFDFLTAFSIRPFRMVGFAGIFGTCVGLLVACSYLVGRLVFAMPAHDRLLVLAILLTFAGIQFSILGLLGEYLVRVYYAAQNLPLYIVQDEVGGFCPMDEGAKAKAVTPTSSAGLMG